MSEADTCDGREKLTRKDAERAAKRIGRRDGHAYHCQVCHDWHVGLNKRGKPKRGRR